jgi:hypothetical protein
MIGRTCVEAAATKEKDQNNHEYDQAHRSAPVEGFTLFERESALSGRSRVTLSTDDRLNGWFQASLIQVNPEKSL